MTETKEQMENRLKIAKQIFLELLTIKGNSPNSIQKDLHLEIALINNELSTLNYKSNDIGSLNENKKDKYSGANNKEYLSKNQAVAYLSNKSGYGAEKVSGIEGELIKQYLYNKKRYSIIIYRQNIVIKDTGGKDNFKHIDLDEGVLNILILLLKYKDKKIPYLSLYKIAWKNSIHRHDIKPDLEITAEIMNSLKNAISDLRGAFKEVDNFVIPHARGGGYICKGSFKFCLILDKINDDFYTLEEV